MRPLLHLTKTAVVLGMLCFAGQLANAATPPDRAMPLSQMKSVLYGDGLMRSFLTEYLQLTAVQAAKVDISLAETRLRLIQASEELETTNGTLDRILSFSEPEKHLDELLTKQSGLVRRILAQEVLGFRNLLAILDGEQRYRLSMLENVHVTEVNGQRSIAFDVVPETPVVRESAQVHKSTL